MIDPTTLIGFKVEWIGHVEGNRTLTLLPNASSTAEWKITFDRAEGSKGDIGKNRARHFI